MTYNYEPSDCIAEGSKCDVVFTACFKKRKQLKVFKHVINISTIHMKKSLLEAMHDI